MSSSSKHAATLSALKASIPAKYLNKLSGELVKQVVITKLSSGSDAASPKPNIMPGMNIAPRSRLTKQGTSKIHKFKPSVSMNQALEWLSEYGNADSSLMFDNNDAILFEKGKFLEFEGDDDDEDGDGDNNNNRQQQQQQDDADSDNDEQQQQDQQSDNEDNNNNQRNTNDSDDDSDDSDDNDNKQPDTIQLGSGMKRLSIDNKPTIISSNSTGTGTATKSALKSGMKK